MTSEKEVINECLLVNYSMDYGDDGPCLIVSYTCDNATKGDILTFHGDTATILYSKLLNIIGINKEDFEE